MESFLSSSSTRTSLYALLLIWISCFNATVTGYHVMGSPEPRDVLARVGDDVVLLCHVEPALDMVEGTVVWSKPGLKPDRVHVLQDGRHITRKNYPQMNQQYKRRTFMFDELLEVGNISLKLFRVKLSDDGTYQCYVPTLHSRVQMQLRVGLGSKPMISSNGQTLQTDQGGVTVELLTCVSGCWFPQPEVSWRVPSGADGNTITANSSANSSVYHSEQDCYKVQSNVTVSQSGQVTCVVHLSHINYTDWSIPHLVTIPAPPEPPGRGLRHGVIVTVVMVTVGLGLLLWRKFISLTEGEKERQDRAAKLRGLLERTPGYLHITDYEELLQRNMNNSYLSVKLGTQSEVKFENVFSPLYNVHIQRKDIHSHHEARQMEINKAGEGTEIQLGQMFKDLSGLIIRTVLTVGYAGIGKTFLVHKFMSDWAKKCFPQDPHLVIPLKFRQLNLLKGQKFTLAQLIHRCVAETRFIEEYILNHIFTELQTAGDNTPFKVMFVMDGYDENNFQFDFIKETDLMNVNDSYPVEDLLVNLIKGKLLPSAHVWITSRPVAANQIPKEFVNRTTEVRGFITDDQKKEFFTKSISDENLASSIFSQIKESKILLTMCEIPVFCWILATVVKNMGTTVRLPKILVELFCHFLMIQIQIQIQRENPEHGEVDREKLIKDAGKVLLKLSKLAFHQLNKGNIIFYEEDLKACGLDVNKDLKKLGFFTTFFKEDDVFFNKTVYCFVHPSIQEFLAAVYLFHCFTQKNTEVLKTFLGDDGYNSDSSLSDFLKAAMKKNMKSESGHLDLFFRFLHGLSLQSNQSLLGGLLGQTENSPEEIQRVIDNLKKMNDPDSSPDRCINIFHCLMEMNDPSVSQGIQQYLESEKSSGKELSETQCSALASILLTSEGVLDELDSDNLSIKP